MPTPRNKTISNQNLREGRSSDAVITAVAGMTAGAISEISNSGITN